MTKLHDRRVTSSGRQLKIFRGPGASRSLLGAGFYMKKLVAYLNNFQRKKLFCVQTLTKLPELTVPSHLMRSRPCNGPALNKRVSAPALLTNKNYSITKSTNQDGLLRRTYYFQWTPHQCSIQTKTHLLINHERSLFYISWVWSLSAPVSHEKKFIEVPTK